VPKGKPRNVEVIEKEGCRFVIATYADGEVVQKRIEPNQKPRRKPLKPFALARKPLRSENN
jgi:hypothetical protein